MKCKIFEETSSVRLEKKINSFLKGNSVYLDCNQPPKILSVHYSCNKDLKGLYLTAYSVLIMYEE